MSELPRDPNKDTQFAQTFVDCLDTVAAYNNRHTGSGYAIGRFLDVVLSMPEQNIADAEPLIFESPEGIPSLPMPAPLTQRPSDTRPPKVSRIDEADMEKDVVQILHTGELDSMGIGLFDSENPGGDAIREEALRDRETSPAELITLIIYGEKFADTIRSLKPSPALQERVHGHVNQLLATTVRLIKAGYQVADSRDEAAQRALRILVDQQLTLYTGLLPVLAENSFAALPAAQHLAEYTARFAAGTLGDYIGAESMGLFHDAARWQRDASPATLAGNWTGAFDYLLQLRDRPQPSPLYTELFNKLRGDFDQAQGWIDAELRKESLSASFANYLRPLQQQMAALAPQWDMLFPLENALYSPGAKKTDETLE